MSPSRETDDKAIKRNNEDLKVAISICRLCYAMQPHFNAGAEREHAAKHYNY